jgi:L-lactate dehydrogenase complex protein LldG
MSAREDILAAIRAHRPQGAYPAPEVPLYDDRFTGDLRAMFEASLARMGGKILAAEDIQPRLDAAGVTVSQVTEFTGSRRLAPDTAPASLADLDIAVLRAAFGVAETGSVCFTEAELGVNAIGYLPQHLIVLLDPADLVPNLHHAYRRPEFRAANYTVFHTGPSATADIEGVLIHGAQGVRSLGVLFKARE